MDQETVALYDKDASAIAARYETADMEAIHSSRDRIVCYWGIMKERAESRFFLEIERSLVRGGCDRRNWQQAAFGGLVENVETLAVHRGLRRWQPWVNVRPASATGRSRTTMKARRPTLEGYDALVWHIHKLLLCSELAVMSGWKVTYQGRVLSL